jgi:hypothetical protein
MREYPWMSMAVPVMPDEHGNDGQSDDESQERYSRVPTHYLGGTPNARARRTGLSGAIPRVPRGVLAETATPEETTRAAHHATQRRRRLLAIFARMMARFYEKHERKWSMGRWDCSLCRERIVAWAWVPHSTANAAPGAIVEVTGAQHEACVSRSMWDVILHYERLSRAGYAQDINALRFS